MPPDLNVNYNIKYVLHIHKDLFMYYVYVIL